MGLFPGLAVYKLRLILGIYDGLVMIQAIISGQQEADADGNHEIGNTRIAEQLKGDQQ